MPYPPVRRLIARPAEPMARSAPGIRREVWQRPQLALSSVGGTLTRATDSASSMRIGGRAGQDFRYATSSSC